LLRAAVETAEKRNLTWHVGGIVSSDVFYHPDGPKVYEVLAAHGVLGVEMETAALYTIAARHGVRALTVCAVSDSLVTHEQLDPAARQSSLTEMVELALTVAVA